MSLYSGISPVRVQKILGLFIAFMFVASLPVFLPAFPAYAATTWTVTDTNDSATSPDSGSLRYAMTNAASGDTIILEVGKRPRCHTVLAIYLIMLFRW